MSKHGGSANRTSQGHLARKRFGQHFLSDEGVIDDIVRGIDPRPGQALVEITFLAELRRRINLDLVPAFGAPRDFL